LDRSLEAAKAGWLQTRVVGRAQDASVASSLNNYMFTKRDFMWDEDLEQKVKSLTTEQVNAAMKKHLKMENINVVMAGDFAKGKK
jgi:zinc protease